MKRLEQRGTFGRWLVTQRKDRGLTPTEVRDRLREQRGYAMAHSTYAMLESGSRQPTQDQRDELIAFFGSEPEPEPQPSAVSPDIAALVAAIDKLVMVTEKQTALLADLWPALNGLVGETRSEHTQAQRRAEEFARILGGQTQLLVATARAVEARLVPASTPGEDAQPSRLAEAG